MKKYLLAIAVVFIIVIFPLGSWWYLRSGFKYRLAAMEALQSKGALDSIWNTTANLDVLKGKVSLVHLASSPISEERKNQLLDIEDQFKASPEFQIISVGDSLELVNNGIESWSELRLNVKNNQSNYLLIDEEINLRNSYDSSEEDLIEIIEHIAILLPREKQKDIELKRDIEK